GLAVDGDVLQAGQASDLTQPRHATALPGARVQGGEDAFEGVVGGMPPGKRKKRRNQLSRCWANRTMSGQSSQLAMTPQRAMTSMSMSRCLVRPATRGSSRRRKCFLIEATEGVAAMRTTGRRANIRRTLWLYTCPDQARAN